MTLETSVRKEKDLFWNMPLLICSVSLATKLRQLCLQVHPMSYPAVTRAVNPPRLQILRIDGERMIDDIIMHGTWRHCEKNVPKRCYWNCNIWPNWFTSYQSLLRILQWHTRFCEKMFDVNSKVDQIRQSIWNFIVKKSNLQEMANFGDYPGDIRL